MSRRAVARAIEDAEVVEAQNEGSLIQRWLDEGTEPFEKYKGAPLGFRLTESKALQHTRDTLLGDLEKARRKSRGRSAKRVDPAIVDAILVPMVGWAIKHQRLIEASEEAIRLRAIADNLEKQGLDDAAMRTRVDAEVADERANEIKGLTAPRESRVRAPWLWATELDAARAAFEDSHREAQPDAISNAMPRLVSMAMYGAPTSGTPPSRYVKLEAMAVRRVLKAIPDANLLMMAHVSFDGRGGPSAVQLAKASEPKRTWAWLIAEREKLPAGEVGLRVEAARKLLRAALLAMETSVIGEDGKPTGDGVPFIRRRAKASAERDTSLKDACFGPVIENGLRVACTVVQLPAWKLEGAASCEACGHPRS